MIIEIRLPAGGSGGAFVNIKMPRAFPKQVRWRKDFLTSSPALTTENPTIEIPHALSPGSRAVGMKMLVSVNQKNKL